MLAMTSRDRSQLCHDGTLPGIVAHHRRGRTVEPFSEAGVEPTISDLLNDPVMEALLRCDRISVSSLRGLIAATRNSLRNRSVEV